MKYLLLLTLLLPPEISAAGGSSANLTELEQRLMVEQESFRTGSVSPDKHERNLTGAAQELEKIWVESDHGFENAVIRSRILVLLGEGGGSVEELGRALKEKPGDPALTLSLGQARLASKDYAGALASANEVLKTDPTNQDALILKNLSIGRAAGVMTRGAPGAESRAPIESRPSSADRGFEFTRLGPKRHTVVPTLSNERDAGNGDGNMGVVELENLLPAYALINYTSAEKEELKKAIVAASAATEKLHRENPNFIADVTGVGALANMTQTLDMVAGGAIRTLGIKFGPVRRSCIDHQTVVGEAVKKAISNDGGLAASFIRVGGQPWPEHHAVLVYPRDSNAVRGGVVLDPWGEQSSAPSDFVYPYTAWKGKYMGLVLGGEEIQEIKSANP